MVVPTQAGDRGERTAPARLSTAARPTPSPARAPGSWPSCARGPPRTSSTAVRDVLAEVGEHASAVGVSGPVSPALAADALVQAAGATRHVRSARRSAGTTGWRSAPCSPTPPCAPASVRPGLARTPHGAGRVRYDADLLRSLEVFLDHNGSWETAARALGVHRHTLRNRMSRVEQLTGLSLDVAHHRVVLYLALATRDDA